MTRLAPKYNSQVRLGFASLIYMDEDEITRRLTVKRWLSSRAGTSAAIMLFISNFAALTVFVLLER